MKCPKRNCEGMMKKSKAMRSTLIGGLPDFPNDSHSITLCEGGPGKLIGCIKCDSCGFSMTLTKEFKC